MPSCARCPVWLPLRIAPYAVATGIKSSPHSGSRSRSVFNADEAGLPLASCFVLACTFALENPAGTLRIGVLKTNPSHAIFCWSIAFTVGLAGCSAPRIGRSGAKGGLLADAWVTISNKEFVDLTHTFSPTTPVWQ